MPFRDDEEALRNRIANLEEDLRERDGERAEIDSLRKRVVDLEEQAREQPPRESPAETIAPALASNEQRTANQPAEPAPTIAPEQAPPIVRLPPRELESKSPLRWLLLLVPALLSACFCGGVGPLILPPIGYLAAPFACPSDYAYAEVRRWTSVTNGAQSQNWDLVCFFKDGRSTITSDFDTHCLIGLFGAFASAFLIWLALLAFRLRSNAQQAREE